MAQIEPYQSMPSIYTHDLREATPVIKPLNHREDNEDILLAQTPSTNSYKQISLRRRMQYHERTKVK